MTKAISKRPLLDAGIAKLDLEGRAGRRVELSALLALFWLVLRQHCRARRLIILVCLLALPSAIAVILRWSEPTHLSAFETGLVFMLLPHALAPLTALLYASGMIQDEIEEQTLTYLLVRPLPKPAIYLIKLLATLLVTIVLVCFFVLVAQVTIYWGAADFWTQLSPARALQTAAIFALSMLAYCSLFGLISLWTRRSLVAGVAYIFVFEGILANIDLMFRKMTIMYYFRVLVERWLHVSEQNWAIDLSKAPSAGDCIWTLVVASLVIIALSTLTFSQREFRMKTPEGS
jgi:ABC-2 type transport system permease protein